MTSTPTDEPSAEQLIGMIEALSNDPVLKPRYRTHAFDLAKIMRSLNGPLKLETGREVILMLLGWNKAASENNDQQETKS